MLLLKLCERSLGLLSTLVLVRVLAPEDFGVVAMAMSFIAVAELVTSLGFDLALIHDQQAEERHYHVAWTCNLLLGIAVMLAMIAAAAPVARFYGRPDVFWVVVALALGPALGGAQNIGVVAFRKDLDFAKEFKFMLSRKLIGVAITVPLAIGLRSYWALVAGMLFSRAAGTWISFVVHPFRPRLVLRGLGDMMSFSSWMLANNIVLALKERASDFVIGNQQGPRALGLYNIAYEFANLPQSELAAPINRALIPSFAKLQQDRAEMRASFAAALAMLAMIAVPAAVAIYAIAPQLVPVLFGDKWLDAIELMKMLALAGVLVALHSPLCAVLLAHGHSREVVVSHVVYVVLLMAGLFVLMPTRGMGGAAWAVLGAAALSTPVYAWQVRRWLGVSLRTMGAALARPASAAAVTVAAAAGLASMVPVRTGVLPNLLPMLGMLVASMALFAVVVLGLWTLAGRPAGAERMIIERLAARIKHRAAKPDGS